MDPYAPSSPQAANAAAVPVRRARTLQEAEACYRLRYEVLVKEQGLDLPDADRRRRLLTDEYDEGALLLGAFRGARSLGTVRMHLGNHDCCPHRDLYGLDGLTRLASGPVVVVSKLVVAPDQRNGRIYRELVRVLLLSMRSAGSSVAVLGCSPRLIPLYRRIGFRSFRESRWVPPYGEIVPLLFEDLPLHVDSPVLAGGLAERSSGRRTA